MDHKKTILLVEDEPIIAKAEKKSLEIYGYNVIIANSGEEAIELFSNNSVIDIILMDINLGHGMDGIATASKILNKRDIPLIFLSSHIEPDIVKQTEKITSYGYVVKNSGITVLDASIKMAFKLFESRKHLEETKDALKKSEKKYRDIFNNSNEGIFQTTLKGRLLTINPAFAHMFGYDSTEEMIASVTEIGQQYYYHPDDLMKILFHLKESDGIIKDFEMQFIRKDGSIFWASLNVHIIKTEGARSYIEGSMIDITKRRLAEEKLTKSNKLLEAVIRQAPFAVHVLEGSFNSINVIIENEESMRIMGEINEGRTNIDANRPEMLVSRFFTADGKEEIPFAMMPSPRAFKGEYVSNEEILFRHPDGTEIIVEASAFPVRDQGDHITAVIVMFSDITEHKKTEKRLNENHEKLEDAQEVARIGFWDLDLADMNLKWSRGLKSIFELDPDSPTPSFDEFWKYVYDEDRAIVEEQASKQLKPSDIPQYSYIYRIITKKGNIKYLQHTGRQITNNEGTLIRIYGSIQDITESMLMDSQKQRDER